MNVEANDCSAQLDLTMLCTAELGRAVRGQGRKQRA